MRRLGDGWAWLGGSAIRFANSENPHVKHRFCSGARAVGAPLWRQPRPLRKSGFTRVFPIATPSRQPTHPLGLRHALGTLTGMVGADVPAAFGCLAALGCARGVPRTSPPTLWRRGGGRQGVSGMLRLTLRERGMEVRAGQWSISPSDESPKGGVVAVIRNALPSRPRAYTSS